MRGQGGFAAAGSAVSHGNWETENVRRASYVVRGDHPERQPTGPSTNGLEQSAEERAAEHRHFGVGIAFESLERERHAHARAVAEVRALGERQLQLVQIGAAWDQL